MIKHIEKTRFSCLTAVILFGVTALFGTANADEPAAEVDPLTFAKGAKAWSETCSRCHNMREPTELRDDQWRAAVMHMRVRAGLTGEEAELILKFLQESNK